MLPSQQRKEPGRSLLGDYSALIGDAVLRQRTRAAEQDARIQTELVNKIRSEFLANMSHELRTPLNTVMGFSKMIADHADRPLKDYEIVDYADTVHQAASNLLAVINNILDMSKLTAGRIALDPCEIELDEILRTCLMSHRPSATQAGQTLIEDIAADLRSVSGDPAKLTQIFGNVLSNAIKFTPKGGRVTLRAHNCGADRVSIVISDTGIGMSADDIAIAMTPFGQVDGGRTRWREGTGLGLPIANSLTRLHDGEMSIRSVPEAGTEVTITLRTSSRMSIAEARDALRTNTL